MVMVLLLNMFWLFTFTYPSLALQSFIPPCSHTHSLFSSRRINQHRSVPHLPHSQDAWFNGKPPTPSIPYGDSSGLAAHVQGFWRIMERNN